MPSAFNSSARVSNLFPFAYSVKILFAIFASVSLMTTFLSLTQISALPSFTSDLAVKYFGAPSGAVVLPLLEKEAETTYYCHILQKNKRELKPFWERYL